MEFNQFEPDTCPFANILLRQNDPNSSNDVQNYHELQPIQNYDNGYELKTEECDLKVDIKDEMSYDDPMLGYHNNSSIYSDFADTKDFEEHPSNVPQQPVLKKKGRPKGAKTGTGKKCTMVRPTRPQGADKLPKMKSSVQKLQLTVEMTEELKKRPWFLQMGVCFQIAPKLNLCKECCKRKIKKTLFKREVDCRFYEFRKLRYNSEGVLEVAGFLDPVSDPIEVDTGIWSWTVGEKRFFRISPRHASFILTHVGGELCRLIEKEKIYLEKYRKADQPIIWKRLIDKVMEICDLCATTLFNVHFICGVCGISLCVDCVNEAKDGEFQISCSLKEHDKHRFEELSLTQIIVGDCMQNLQKGLHEICQLWNIEHDCRLMQETKLDVNKATQNLVRNLRLEMKTGKSVVGRELLHKNATIDVDLSKVGESIEMNETDDFDSFLKTNHEQVHCKPVRHHNVDGKENVYSISRSMSQPTSSMFYKNVPHRWLCENKLLRLLDPLHPENEAFFHEQWQRGQPVLISNLLDHFQRDLWLPQAFSAEFGQNRSDFINCMTGNLVRNREISSFWDGFEAVDKRLMDNDGNTMLLKLKDWPPDSDFKNIMPSRFEDIMKNLPLNAYTNRSGDLNIVKYLPFCFLHPDLGPKGYFAYGSPFFLKAGTTNLHLDIADACNVMCYIGFPRDKSISVDEYIAQGFEAILEADCDAANVNRVIEDGEIPGAIWHIYDAVDADRIRDFLLKIAQERGFQVAPDHDVIHDQNWYLDGELRGRLYKEYGVKGYAIVQCLGDCIVLPAGTPHQVRNIYSCIKIAEDFVSPQQVAHCLHLSNQFRKLTKTHTNNEEKLNIKNVAYHSIKEAIASLVNLTSKKNNIFKQEKPSTQQDKPSIPVQEQPSASSASSQDQSASQQSSTVSQPEVLTSLASQSTVELIQKEEHLLQPTTDFPISAEVLTLSRENSLFFHSQNSQPTP